MTRSLLCPHGVGALRIAALAGGSNPILSLTSVVPVDTFVQAEPLRKIMHPWSGRVTLHHSSFPVLHDFVLRVNFNFLISCRGNGTWRGTF